MNDSEISADGLVQNVLLVLTNWVERSPSLDNKSAQVAVKILQEHKPTISIRYTTKPDEYDGQVVAIWAKTVDPETAKHAQPTQLKKGTLFIAVDSALWLSEIVRYRRKDILARLQSVLSPENVKRLSFRVQQPVVVRIAFRLPTPLWRSSIAPDSGPIADHNEGTWAQKIIRDAFQAIIPQADLDVSFDPEPLPPPPRVSIPFDQHFSVCEAAETLERHYFGQLHLDLLCAIREAESALRDTGADPLKALEQGFTRIAGQRWARFKSAQNSADAQTMAEMHAFGIFWYEVTKGIRKLGPGMPGESETHAE